MPFKNEKMGFNKMRTIFFFSLIVIFGLIMLYLVKPLFYPIFWAAILAIMFYPTYQWLLKHLKSPILCSFLCLLMIISLIIIPLVILSILVINQSVILYQTAAQGDLLIQVKGIGTWLSQSSFAPYLENVRTYWNENFQDLAKTTSTFLFNNLQNLTQNSITFLGLFFTMLYALFYFLKDGARILKRLMHLSPLGDKYEEILYSRFTSTARATLKGTLVVGAIQGLLGGIIFFITGIKGSLIWGVLMAVASIIPVFGTSLIWLPAGIIMLALGNTWQGVTILIAGFAMIGTIDNLIRPKLIGRDTQIHPLLVLFATLGGLIMFGVSGLVIGPVIAALFLAFINIYDQHYSTELKNN